MVGFHFSTYIIFCFKLMDCLSFELGYLKPMQPSMPEELEQKQAVLYG